MLRSASKGALTLSSINKQHEPSIRLLSSCGIVCAGGAKPKYPKRFHFPKSGSSGSPGPSERPGYKPREGSRSNAGPGKSASEHRKAGGSNQARSFEPTRADFTDRRTGAYDRSRKDGDRTAYRPVNQESRYQRPQDTNARGPIEPTTSRRLARDLEPAPAPKVNKFDPSSPANLQHSQSTFITKSISKEAIPNLPFSDYSLNPALKESVERYFSNSNPDPSGETPSPSPIQHLSLQHFVGSKLKPVNRKGSKDEIHQVLLGSDTGSGKTLAYLLPLLHFLKKTDPGMNAIPLPSSPKLPFELDEEAEGENDPNQRRPTYPRALVLAPTHELTRQLTKVAKSFTHDIKLSVQGMSSTASGTLKEGKVDVLVGTARGFGRLIEKGAIDLRGLEWIAIDEADVLLGPDFEGETSKILDQARKARAEATRTEPEAETETEVEVEEVKLVSPSVILSTATIPPSLIAYIRAHFPECAKVLSPTLHRLPTKLQTRFVPWSGSGNKLADVVHELRKTFAAEGTERRQALQTAKEDEPFEKSKILIFANTVNKVKALRKMLEEKDIPVLGITGEAEERIRGSNGLLDEFLLQPGQAPGMIKKRKGGNNDKAPRVLVTTSLLSRGLDFAPSVKHVFLLDEPRDILDFMHRAGRTGRAGRVGNVVVFGSGSGGGRAGTLGRRQFSPERRMKQWQAGSKLGKDLKDVLRRD